MEYIYLTYIFDKHTMSSLWKRKDIHY